MATPQSKCNDFFGAPHRLPPPPPPPHPPHDLYTFTFPGFSSSFGGSKLNEISVIQSLSSRMTHLSPVANSSGDMMTVHLTPLMKPHPYVLHPPHPPPATIPPSHLTGIMKCRLDPPAIPGENNNRLEKSGGGSMLCGNSGELDLSLKKTLLSLPPPPVRPPSTAEMLPSPPWAWKTSCNRCNKVCSSPGALELHMKTHADWLREGSSPKPLMT